MPRARQTATKIAVQDATTVSAAVALAVSTLAVSVAGGMMAVAAIMGASPQRGVVRIAAVNTNTSTNTCQVNTDNDNFYACGPGCPTTACDCNDRNPSVFPGALETCTYGDDDCNPATPDPALVVGQPCDDFDFDTCLDDRMACFGSQGLYCRGELPGEPDDRDGDGFSLCSPTCTAAQNCDCNDTNAAVRPGAPETCDGRDNDCDGAVDEQCLRTFRRGDANTDGTVNILDVSFIINWLSLGGSRPRCMDAADGNDDGRVDISDAKFIADWYASGGKVPPPPGPYTKGPDPTADQLDCQYYP